eukprot:CAMPEP_0184438414 /NCGR_PEP_ID=MMETSP0738-20130409/649908_1 /TAXON_ID=385413 /ORGANISM="Thalassiosira miniscula, Strain CCMP1093" /LENGTH=61 /DNA_ID=CAMNT_0026805743 /DNA_START=317 /DNA_END=502 /DNA_ORIENTATION=-
MIPTLLEGANLLLDLSLENIEMSSCSFKIYAGAGDDEYALGGGMAGGGGAELDNGAKLLES